MSSRRKIFWAMFAVLVAGLGASVFAQPVFETNTPKGWSVSDSTATPTFVTDTPVTVQVDLNAPANATYPVIGNFQKLERSEPFFATAQAAPYMSQAIKLDANGIIHRAWIERRGIAAGPTGTPVYGVVYAKSLDGGVTFSDTASVSGTLTFDMITPNQSGTGGFSTVDIVVDSKGNPRVVYAMDWSGDGVHDAGGSAQQQYGTAGVGVENIRCHNNILFNYSNDGGSSWLPANSAVVINDTSTIGRAANTRPIAAVYGQYKGRKCAFPRMDITSTDDIFIVYQRSMDGHSNTGSIATYGGGPPDIMLAKMDADSLKLGSAQAVRIGSEGAIGSWGGVRIDQDAQPGVSADIAVGDDDVLHIVWYATSAGATNGVVMHKQLEATSWTDVSGFGWAQQSAGSTAGTFSDRASSGGSPTFNTALYRDGAAGVTNATNHVKTWDRPRAGTSEGWVHLFPTVVVDKARTPDRIYTVWKWADSRGNDENIAYRTSDYNGQSGNNASWSSTSMAFTQGTSPRYNINGGPMFQTGSLMKIGDYWQYVDRVAAVVDQRKVTSGDLHIVFSSGLSAGDLATATNANQLFYSRFNGAEWELPQSVASSRNGAAGGVGATYDMLYEPDISIVEGNDNVYLTFVGGVNSADLPGRGYATANGSPLPAGTIGNVSPLAYFKVIGRVTTFDDVSIPSGAYVYRMEYDPVLPQTTASTLNMVTVTAAGNTDGSGIGATQPGSSSAPGGFLTGRWRRLGYTLGITSLQPGESGAVFKGAVSQTQAQNDNGVWQGQIDDDGTLGYGEWGDDGDKVGLLVKLNVLAGDSSTNLFVVENSTAARGVWSPGSTQADSSSQSLTLTGAVAFSRAYTVASFVRGITGETPPWANTTPAAWSSSKDAPLGSYFQMGANITIVAANTAPVVAIDTPNASATSEANETYNIIYNLYDADDDYTSATTPLTAELYFYSDNSLSTARDIRTFATLIVDEQDDTNANGTDDFVEGTGATNKQTYTWDDPGATLEALGFAPITKTPDGYYYIYIVADDGSNLPVYAVSSGRVRIRHIPIFRSIKPVAADTVDTGEYENLNNTNPYKVRFSLIDYDDNAQVTLFYSTSSALAIGDVGVSGTFPSKTLTLAGASAMVQSDTLRTDDDIEFDFDVTAQGSSGDSIIAQGAYTIYAVIADDDTVAFGKSTSQLAVRHSPAFEFTAPLLGTVRGLNSTQQFGYTVEWQRGRSDQDLDGNAIISLYYTGVDPNTRNFSGTDSTGLLATTGSNPGNAILISGNIREDDEGGGDQYVWDFKNPPGELPKVFRQTHTTSGGRYTRAQYQDGATTDTAWVYAVLHDSLGNTRVQGGGAVLLLGSQDTPASEAPRVIMKTPPAGDQDVVNGDVVKLSWDAFLIDDGTGTDDAYLRLYAATPNKYTTITELEANMYGVSGARDVYLVNSLTGNDTNPDAVATLRESGDSFYTWDTKTTSFQIVGTPTELQVFIAASMNPFRTHGAAPVYVNGQVDSIASGLGSQSQRAVLSSAPGVLKVFGTDPLYSVELSPSSITATSGDTLDLDVLVNSQGSSVDQMTLYLNVPRNFFEVVDQDAGTAGLQPFADSSGAFQTPSTIAQNDTTPGDDQWMKLNFVEHSMLGEVIGRTISPYDSSQVAARLQLVCKQYSGGANQDTVLQWSVEPGRLTAFYSGVIELAQPARKATVVMTPRARLLVTVPLEGRVLDYSDTLDAHLREIGSTQDITDSVYIASNDLTVAFAGGGSSGTLIDSVTVKSDEFGFFSLKEIPEGVYELTVKAPGFITGRTDTLTLFNGLQLAVDPTYGSDALGNLSPAEALGALRGGDATNDNQVDIADANLIFSLWNKVKGEAGFVVDADIDADDVIGPLDLGFVTKNYGVDGFGAPPVFKLITAGGDNSGAIARVEGLEDVEAWWPGREFEVRARVEGMSDVAAYGLRLTYDPERVKPLDGDRAVEQGSIFDENPAGSLFFHRVLPGAIDVGAGRIGADWSASGDAELVTVRFVSLTDDPGIIDIASGQLGNSAHAGVPLRVKTAQALPTVAALHQNYPNPFNPSTEIRFELPTARDVQLRIYNQLGQTVRTLVDQRMKAGIHSMKWDGSSEAGQSVASGVYFYNIEAGDFTQIRKMTLVK